jgi:hypothetical protein
MNHDLLLHNDERIRLWWRIPQIQLFVDLCRLLSWAVEIHEEEVRDEPHQVLRLDDEPLLDEHLDDVIQMLIVK